MSKRKHDDGGESSIKKSKTGQKSEFPLHDDNLYHIMTFLESDFIIRTCMMVSKQWNEQARRVPIKLSLHSVDNIPSIHLNLTDLEYCGPNEELCDWITDSPQMINLTALCVNSDELSYPLGDESCERLANCSHLRNLTCLKLPMNIIGNDGCMSIINSPYLTKLTELDLSFNEFDDEALKELADSSNMTNLTSLSLAELRAPTSLHSHPTAEHPGMGRMKRLEKLKPFHPFHLFHPHDHFFNLFSTTIFRHTQSLSQDKFRILHKDNGTLQKYPLINYLALHPLYRS